MTEAGWQIEQACPQCGAPVTLEETDRLLSCPYCRVKLYIATEGTLRYALPARATEAERLRLVPYWRFRGQVCTCVPYAVETGLVDVTHRATDFPGTARTHPPIPRVTSRSDSCRPSARPADGISISSATASSCPAATAGAPGRRRGSI